MLPTIPKSKKVIYLDHAATTYLNPAVKKAMEPFLDESYGNPTSLYTKGREARSAINSSRKTIAQIIGSRPEEIVFTAGGSESVNLAIFGIARAFEIKNKRKGHLHRRGFHSLCSETRRGGCTSSAPAARSRANRPSPGGSPQSGWQAI